MGVFNKLKGIFYDEVVVDEEENEEEKELSKVSKFIKREHKEHKPEKQSIEIPKVEEIKYKTVEPEIVPLMEEKKEPIKTDNTFNERDLFRSERTFNFVDFTEDEVEEINEVPKRNVLSEQNRNAKVEAPTIQEGQKVFKPSPVISPVWGVLDKDYKKEEIQSKKVENDKLTSSVTSYDSVRRKAYGTLEDELEDTLNSMNKISTSTIKKEINKEISKVDKDMELLEQKTSKIEDLISKIEDATNEMDNNNLTVGQLEDKVELDNFEEPKKEVSDKTLTDNTLEHDLFNLIDSMYDKED